MTDTSTISFDIDTSDATAAIGIAVWIDTACVYQTAHLTQTQQIKIEDAITNDNEHHELRIVISGKTIEHTKIDEHGNITQDVTITVSNFDIDGIDIAQIFNEKCVYTHNFNGTQAEIQDTFHGIAGCNGTISFRFSTPIYLWLLENM